MARRRIRRLKRQKLLPTNVPHVLARGHKMLPAKYPFKKGGVGLPLKRK